MTMTWVKLFEDFSDIDAICQEYGIKNYTINPDGGVDVNGDVDLSNKRLKSLPLKFGRVSGSFDCIYNQLTTLEGAPTEVGVDFYCSYNQLTTLEGAPKEVGGYFSCNNNQLTTLEGAPKEVGEGFYCSYNKLTTLEGAPKEVGDNVWCDNNPLPKKVINFEDKKYILKWQDDYGIWQNGKLNHFRWQQMINDYDMG
jgi:hypothetical protein